MAFFCLIGATDFGPAGQARMMSVEAEVAGINKVGRGTINLTWPETAGPYTITNGMKVQVYRTGGGAAFGYIGGVVSDKRIIIPKRARPGQVFTSVDVQDLNVAFDVVVRDSLLLALTISPGTMAAQVKALQQGIQWNGLGSVNWDLNSNTVAAGGYVGNLTGATVLPGFTVNGKSWRWGMDRIMANAQAADSTLRPRYHAALLSDGTGGVGAYIVVYDAATAVSPSFVIASDANVSAGEYPIYALDNQTQSTKLTNRQQAIWHAALGDYVETYQNDTSQTTYPNPFINHNRTGATGFWMDEAVDDKESTSASEAQTKLQKIVKAKEYPQQTMTVTVDNIEIHPGQVVTLRVPEEGISANFVASSVRVTFPVPNDLSKTRVDIVLGRRRRGLFDTGEEDEVAAPAEYTSPPNPPTSLAVTANVLPDPYADYANITLQATVPAQPPAVSYYRVYNATTGEIVADHITTGGATVSTTIQWLAGLAFAFYMTAVSAGGLQSVPSNTVTGTATSRYYFEELPNGSFEIPDRSDPTLPYGWSRSVAGTSTVLRTGLQQKDGHYSLKLYTDGTNAAIATSGRFPARSGGLDAWIALWHLGAAGSEPLNVTVRWYYDNGSEAGFQSQAPGVGLAWAETVTPRHPPTHPPNYSVWVEIELKLEPSAGAKTVYVDAVRYSDQVGTSGLGDAQVTSTKMADLSPSPAGTWDRTTVSIKGQVTAGVSLQGTSFPGSPSTGDRYYRTDLRRWGYYDGTRWLSEEVELGMATYRNSGSGTGQPYPQSGSHEALACSLLGDYAFMVTRWAMSWYTGTWAAGNYWTFTLRRLDNSMGVATLATIQTNGGGWAKLEATSFSNNPLNAADVWLQVYLTPTGTPGDVYVITAVKGRWVLT